MNRKDKLLEEIALIERQERERLEKERREAEEAAEKYHNLKELAKEFWNSKQGKRLIHKALINKSESNQIKA